MFSKMLAFNGISIIILSKAPSAQSSKNLFLNKNQPGYSHIVPSFYVRCDLKVLLAKRHLHLCFVVYNVDSLLCSHMSTKYTEYMGWFVVISLRSTGH